MINILIVDDKVEKHNAVVNVLKEVFDSKDINVETASYINDAKKILRKNNVDIMVLDICLPIVAGEKNKEDGGIILLKDIRGSDKYVYPKYIISLSEYDSLTTKFENTDGFIHTSIFYNPMTEDWRKKLAKAFMDCHSVITNNVSKREYSYDIAVICALKEELDQIKRGLHNVKQIKISEDTHIYYEGCYDGNGRDIKVVVANSLHMGMVPATQLTTKLIYNFTPKYIVMTGIAAGIKGKVNMGDVVVAEYAWDYGAGKEESDGEKIIHRNTIKQISIGSDIHEMVEDLSSNFQKLALIKKDFNGKKPDLELKLHIGGVASGSSVIASSKIIEKIKEQIRDFIAIEMEIFGFYYACKWSLTPQPKFLAIKSICDFGDEEKNDDYHLYAAFTSSKVFENLAKDYFIYD